MGDSIVEVPKRSFSGGHDAFGDDSDPQPMIQSLSKSGSRSMFVRLWLRGITVKRPQAVVALVSLLVGAATISLLLNLYSGVRRKMTEEFRAYGANVVIAPRVPESSLVAVDTIGESVLPALQSLLQRNGTAIIPILNVVAAISKQSAEASAPANAVAVGTDFAGLHRINPGWKLEPARVAPDDESSVVGANVAKQLGLSPGDSILVAAPSVEPGRQAASFRVAAIVTTGASEDNQVMVPLAALQRVSDLEGRISLVELSVPGDKTEVAESVRRLAAALPGLDVRPVLQIVYSEGKTIATIRSLVIWLTAIILGIIMLCVAATMTAIVLERRRDVAVMKALGAGDRTVMELFLAEGACMGLVGGLAGALIGVLLARAVAYRIFHTGVGLTWWTLPFVVGVSMLLAVIATALPVRSVRRVQPALVLKGE
jgi:putative ABC transport system permease protein